MLIRYISYIDVNYCLVNNKLLLLFRKIVIKMMDNHVLSIGYDYLKAICWDYIISGK